MRRSRVGKSLALASLATMATLYAAPLAKALFTPALPAISAAMPALTVPVMQFPEL